MYKNGLCTPKALLSLLFDSFTHNWLLLLSTGTIWMPSLALPHMLFCFHISHSWNCHTLHLWSTLEQPLLLSSPYYFLLISSLHQAHTQLHSHYYETHTATIPWIKQMRFFSWWCWYQLLALEEKIFYPSPPSTRSNWSPLAMINWPKSMLYCLLTLRCLENQTCCRCCCSITERVTANGKAKPFKVWLLTHTNK